MDKLAKLIQEAIRILYCSSESRFAEIFGADQASKLWFDYREKYSGNQGRFIVELDLKNMRKLTAYTQKELGQFPPSGTFNPGHILGFGMGED